MSEEEKYMTRCVELAQLGFGHTAPNPMVGALLVRGGRIISEGFHAGFGKRHAEADAIHNLSNPSLAEGSTLFVNLEPCSHFGKTPPCTELIIKSKIKRVVIGNIDINKQVKGSGAEILRNAGIEVTTGILDNESKDLNKRYFTYHEHQRPYVILKWAQSKDGFIGKRDAKNPVVISNEISRVLSHQWRSEEQAILVGTNTALTDNPQLTARLVNGKNPVRICIDRNNKVPVTHHLFDGSAKTMIFSNIKKDTHQNVQYHYLDEHQFNFLPENILYSLYLHEIQSLIVEGGAATLQKFIDSNLWDEARVFTSENNLIDGISTPVFSGEKISNEKSGSDSLKIFKNKK